MTHSWREGVSARLPRLPRLPVIWALASGSHCVSGKSLPTLFRVLSKVASPLHWLRRGTWTWKWPLFNVSTLPTRGACLTAAGILQWGLPFMRGSQGWALEPEQFRSCFPGVCKRCHPAVCCPLFPRANGAMPTSRKEWLVSLSHQAILNVQDQH